MDRGSQLDEEEEEEDEEEEDEEKEEDEERKAADIKSNNPHLAGAEKKIGCFLPPPPRWAFLVALGGSLGHLVCYSLI